MGADKLKKETTSKLYSSDFLARKSDIKPTIVPKPVEKEQKVEQEPTAIVKVDKQIEYQQELRKLQQMEMEAAKDDYQRSIEWSAMSDGVTPLPPKPSTKEIEAQRQFVKNLEKMTDDEYSRMYAERQSIQAQEDKSRQEELHKKREGSQLGVFTGAKVADVQWGKTKAEIIQNIKKYTPSYLEASQLSETELLQRQAMESSYVPTQPWVTQGELSADGAYPLKEDIINKMTEEEAQNYVKAWNDIYKDTARQASMRWYGGSGGGGGFGSGIGEILPHGATGFYALNPAAQQAALAVGYGGLTGAQVAEKVTGVKISPTPEPTSDDRKSRDVARLLASDDLNVRSQVSNDLEKRASKVGWDVAIEEAVKSVNPYTGFGTKNSTYPSWEGKHVFGVPVGEASKESARSGSSGITTIIMSGQIAYMYRNPNSSLGEFLVYSPSDGGVRTLSQFNDEHPEFNFEKKFADYLIKPVDTKDKGMVIVTDDKVQDYINEARNAVTRDEFQTSLLAIADKYKGEELRKNVEKLVTKYYTKQVELPKGELADELKTVTIDLNKLKPVISAGITEDIFFERKDQKLVESSVRVGKAEDFDSPDELKGNDVAYFEAMTPPDVGTGKGKTPILMKYIIIKNPNGTVGGLWYRQAGKDWEQGNYTIDSKTKEVKQMMCSGPYCGNMKRDLEEGISYLYIRNWNVPSLPSQKFPQPIDIPVLSDLPTTPVPSDVGKAPTDITYAKPKDELEFKEWKGNFENKAKIGEIIVPENSLFAGVDVENEYRIIDRGLYDKFNSEVKKSFDNTGMYGVMDNFRRSSMELSNYTNNNGETNIIQYAIDARNRGKSYELIKQVLSNALYDEASVSEALSYIPNDNYVSDTELKTMNQLQKADYIVSHPDDLRFMDRGLFGEQTNWAERIAKYAKENKLTANEVVKLSYPVWIPNYQQALMYQKINNDISLNENLKKEAVGKVFAGEYNDWVQGIKTEVKPLWDSSVPSIAPAIAKHVFTPFGGLQYDLAGALIFQKDMASERIKAYDIINEWLAEAGTPEQIDKVTKDFYGWTKGNIKAIGLDGKLVDVVLEGSKVGTDFNTMVGREFWDMAKSFLGVIPITLLKAGDNMSMGKINEVAADAANFAGSALLLPVFKYGEVAGYAGRGEFGKVAGTPTGLVAATIITPAHIVGGVAKGVVGLGDMVFRKGEVWMPNAARQGGSGIAFLNVPKSYYKLIDEINGIVADKGTVDRISKIKDPIDQVNQFKSLLSEESRAIWDAGKQLYELAHQYGDIPNTWNADRLDFSVVKDFPIEASDAVRAVFKRNSGEGYFKGSFPDIMQIKNAPITSELKEIIQNVGKQFDEAGDVDYVVTGKIKPIEYARKVADVINQSVGRDIARVSGTDNNAKIFIDGSKSKGGVFQFHTDTQFTNKPFGWEKKFTFVDVDGVKMANFKDQLLRRGEITLYPTYDELAGSFGLATETPTGGMVNPAFARRGFKDWFRVKYQMLMVIDNLKKQGKTDIAEQLQNNLDIFEGGLKKTYKEGGAVKSVQLDTDQITLPKEARDELLDIVSLLQEVAIREGRDSYFVTPEGTIIRITSPSEKLLHDTIYHVTDNIDPYRRLSQEGKFLRSGYVLDENGKMIPAPSDAIFFSPQEALAYLRKTKGKKGGIVAIRATAADRDRYLTKPFRTEQFEEANVTALDVFGRKIDIGGTKVVAKIFDELVWNKKPSLGGEKLTVLSSEMKSLENKINQGVATIDDIKQTFAAYYEKRLGRKATSEEIETNTRGFIQAELGDRYAIESNGKIVSLDIENVAYPLGEKYSVRVDFDKYPMVWFAFEDALKQGLGIPNVDTVKAIQNLAMKQALFNVLYPRLNKNIRVIFDPLSVGKGSPLEFGKESWQYSTKTLDDIGELIDIEKKNIKFNSVSVLNDEIKGFISKGGDVVEQFTEMADRSIRNGSNIVRDSIESGTKLVNVISKKQLDKTISGIEDVINQNRGTSLEPKLNALKDKLNNIKNSGDVDFKQVVTVLQDAQRELIKEKVVGLGNVATKILADNIIKWNELKSIGDQSTYVLPEHVSELIDISSYYDLVEHNKRGTILNQVRQGLTNESRQVWDAQFQLSERLFKESLKIPLQEAKSLNLKEVFAGRFTDNVSNRLKGVLQEFSNEMYLGGSFPDYLQMYGRELPEFMKPKDVDIHLFADSNIESSAIGMRLLEELVDYGDIGESKILGNGDKVTAIVNPIDDDLRFSMYQSADGAIQIVDFRFNPDGEIIFDISNDKLFNRSEMLVPDWSGVKRFKEIDGIIMTDLRNQLLDRGTILLMPATKYLKFGDSVELWDMGGTFGQRSVTAKGGEPTGIRLSRGIKDWNRFEYHANYFIDKISESGNIDLAQALRDRLEIAKDGVKTTFKEGGTKGGLLEDLGNYLENALKEVQRTGIVPESTRKLLAKMDKEDIVKVLRENAISSKDAINNEFIINLGDLSRVYYSNLKGLPDYSIGNAFTVIPKDKSIEEINSAIRSAFVVSPIPTSVSETLVPPSLTNSVPVVSSFGSGATIPTVDTSTTITTTIPTTVPTSAIPSSVIPTPITPPSTTTTITTSTSRITTPPKQITGMIKSQRSWEDLSEQEKLASIVWKQGWANWALVPPYSQKELIYSKEPFAGTKVHKGPLAAYKSVAKVKGSALPEKITIDLGIMDLSFVRDKDGKDVKVYYTADPQQRTRSGSVEGYPQATVKRFPRRYSETKYTQVSSIK